jgi:hypothetical protein
VLEHDLAGDHDAGDVLADGTSYITESSTSSMMARSPRAPVPRRIAWSATASSASSVNSSSTPSRSKSRSYCLTSALRGSVRMRTSAILVEVAHAGDDRKPADELGDHAELEQVLGQHVAEDVGGLAVALGVQRGARSRCPCGRCALDDLLEAGERASRR